MNKVEFVDVLGKSLKGKVDENEYRKQMEYYSSYISEKVAEGKREEDVVEELGDPRLIAKTIVNTYIMKDNPINAGYREKSNYNHNAEESYGNEQSEKRNDNIAMKKMLYTIFAVLIVLCIIMFVLKLFFVLLPLLAVFVVVFAILRFINGR